MNFKQRSFQSLDPALPEQDRFANRIWQFTLTLPSSVLSVSSVVFLSMFFPQNLGDLGDLCESQSLDAGS